uniref:Ovule protein n=1 Tax=Haemonchus contortus TaxID=6289 RepID=A0A7I4YAX8_HAECO
ARTSNRIWLSPTAQAFGKKGLLPMDTAAWIDPFKASGIWKRECASWAGGRRSRQRIIFEIFRCDCLSVGFRHCLSCLGLYFDVSYFIY